MARADGYAEDAWEMVDLVSGILGVDGPDGQEAENGYGRGGKVKVR
ncbi:MAG: hypothetical protein ACE5H9_04575 [Anaerolineae bacterium]